ncbi:hypothetical protein BV25DRAFT_1920597 [Artomyces pyxidatus]|uniref:Uncharacterized protein n=1 Tax=Artomyces pyxidatus TaxID=48021 RepID=A0ACB8SKK1_9AGAM|nr:hypothetical protein BV25DRAFT_1920597 [Artomyces pyxidatus]
MPYAFRGVHIDHRDLYGVSHGVNEKLRFYARLTLDVDDANFVKAVETHN